MAFQLLHASLQTLAPNSGLRGTEHAFRTPFLDLLLGARPWHLPPEPASWCVLPQAPFWGGSCPVLVLLSPAHSLMYSHFTDSQAQSARFHGAFLAPAGSQGRRLALFMCSLPQSLLHQHSLYQEQALCWAWLSEKGEPEKGSWGWDSEKASWERQAEREYAR